MRMDARGLTNLPGERPYILCANHQSYLDGFLMLSVLPYDQVRRMVLLGGTEYFSTATTAWFADRFNIAVVDPDANLVQAMRASARALREGRSLLLFPEGQRSIDGEIGPLRRGAAILACHLRVPIVPLVLDGPHRIWPRGGSFRGLAPVTIRILPPIEPPVATADFDAATMAMTRLLEEQFVATLSAIRAEPR
jgi:long-chain acyl-CoA synthetase